jgi:hypothetical protein
MNGSASSGRTLLRYRGEKPLLAGLLVWSLAFAPFFPILWLVGQLFVGPVALLLLAFGVWRARNMTASTTRRLMDLALFVIAVVALYCSSLQTMSVANQLFPAPLGTSPPTFNAFALTIALWLVSGILWWIWLRRWTNWPARRRLGWAIAVVCVPILSLIGFWLLLLTDPPRSA